MGNISIELSKEAQRTFDSLAKLGRIDLRPVLKTIGDSYRREVSGIFGHVEPRDPSLRWAPLSSAYSEWKEKHFPGRPILVRTGRLKDSMVNEQSSDNISTIKRTSAEFGTSVEYAKFHDDGTQRLPKRNFSEPGERRLSIMKKQLSDGIAKQFEMKGIDVEGSLFA